MRHSYAILARFMREFCARKKLVSRRHARAKPAGGRGGCGRRAGTGSGERRAPSAGTHAQGGHSQGRGQGWRRAQGRHGSGERGKPRAGTHAQGGHSQGRGESRGGGQMRARPQAWRKFLFAGRKHGGARGLRACRENKFWGQTEKQFYNRQTFLRPQNLFSLHAGKKGRIKSRAMLAPRK